MSKTPEQLADVTLPELNLTLAQALKISATIRQALKDARGQLITFTPTRYTPTERGDKAKHAGMTPDQERSFQAILDSADTVKAQLVDLAKLDAGADPNELETDVLRARAELFKDWRLLVDELKVFGEEFLDMAISIGLLAHIVDSKLYKRLKQIAENNGAVKSLLTGARAYFDKFTAHLHQSPPTPTDTPDPTKQ